MKKIILCSLFILFLFSSCGQNENSEVIESSIAEIVTYDLNLKIDFTPNLLFSKYDVEMIIDDSIKEYLQHGENFQKEYNFEEGEHKIEFKHANDSSIHSSVYLTLDDNLEVEYRIECESDTIEINRNYLYKESDVADDEVRIDKSLYNYSGKNYKEVENDLKQQGFCNIKSTPIYDIYWGITETESIKSIYIDNRSDVKSGEIFNKNVEILIEYHMPCEDDPAKQTTKPQTTTTTSKQTEKTTTTTINKDTEVKEKQQSFESDQIFADGHPKLGDKTSKVTDFWKDHLVFDAVVIKDKDNYDSEFHSAYIVLDCFEQIDDSKVIDSDTIKGIYLYFDRCDDIPRVTIDNAVDVLKSYLPIEKMKGKYELTNSKYRDIWPDVWSFKKNPYVLQYDYYASYKLVDLSEKTLPEWITVHLYTDSFGIVVEAAIIPEEFKDINEDSSWNYDYLSGDKKMLTGQVAKDIYFDNELNINYPRPTENTILREGDVLAEVGWLQSALNKAMNVSLNINCEFDSNTKSEVIEFQTRCNLGADGVVGSSTIKELLSIVRGEKNMPSKVITTLAPRSIEPVQQATEPPKITEAPQQPIISNAQDFVLNTNTKKYHYPSCGEINRMKEENKSYYHGSAQDLDNQGYTPCGKCHPR